MTKQRLIGATLLCVMLFVALRAPAATPPCSERCVIYTTHVVRYDELPIAVDAIIDATLTRMQIAQGFEAVVYHHTCGAIQYISSDPRDGVTFGCDQGTHIYRLRVALSDSSLSLAQIIKE